MKRSDDDSDALNFQKLKAVIPFRVVHFLGGHVIYRSQIFLIDDIISPVLYLHPKDMISQNDLFLINNELLQNIILQMIIIYLI